MNRRGHKQTFNAGRKWPRWECVKGCPGCKGQRSPEERAEWIAFGKVMNNRMPM